MLIAGSFGLITNFPNVFFGCYLGNCHVVWTFLYIKYALFNRWDHISASVDDRTKAERGEEPLSENGGQYR